MRFEGHSMAIQGDVSIKVHGCAREYTLLSTSGTVLS